MAASSTRPAAAGGYPAGFRFGAATAAYQIEGAVAEGGRGESIWDRFCRLEGAVANGDTGDVACDHYHRWREDLDLMAELGLESYRFSIAWPRVQPDGRGPVNREGLDFYSRLVDGLLERGIEPIATLYHWDLPQALQDEGGWAARDTAERFAEYTAIVADGLGDRVSQWITHNEPWVVAFLGHEKGDKAPGVRDWRTAIAVAHHLLLSHGLAVPVLRQRTTAGGSVGITLNLHPMRPASGSQEDHAAAVRLDGHQNRWFLDPVLRGRYPDDLRSLYEQRLGPLEFIREADLPVVAAPVDFLGVNYYAPSRAKADPGALPLEAVGDRPAEPTTAMGWEVDASGLHEMLVRLGRDYGPLAIAITENGSAYPGDEVVDGRVEGPRAAGVPADAPRGGARGGRRRGGRPPVSRVVAARQLRVGARVRHALRARARRLRDAGAHAEVERALVSRPHRRGSPRRAGLEDRPAYFRPALNIDGSWVSRRGMSRRERLTACSRPVVASGPCSPGPCPTSRCSGW
jgi:beta-glucosidase